MNTLRTFESSMGGLFLRSPKTISVYSRPATDRFGGCHNRAAAAEKRALAALLEEYIDCFQRYLKARDEGGKVLFQDAAEWIFKEDGEWEFSFENVCGQLGLNPISLREKLLQWRTAALRGALAFQPPR